MDKKIYGVPFDFGLFFVVVRQIFGALMLTGCYLTFGYLISFSPKIWASVFMVLFFWFCSFLLAGIFRMDPEERLMSHGESDKVFLFQGKAALCFTFFWIFLLVFSDKAQNSAPGFVFLVWVFAMGAIPVVRIFLSKLVDFSMAIPSFFKKAGPFFTRFSVFSKK
jgi:hypothetical protein